MASNSKGLSKKHSPLQKAHYQGYRLINKRLSNKIARIKRHIKRNAAMVNRRTAKLLAMTPKQREKTMLVPIAIDEKAISALKEVDEMKRYNVYPEEQPHANCIQRVTIEEAPSGQWVRYEDAAVIEAKLAGAMEYIPLSSVFWIDEEEKKDDEEKKDE